MWRLYGNNKKSDAKKVTGQKLGYINKKSTILAQAGIQAIYLTHTKLHMKKEKNAATSETSKI